MSDIKGLFNEELIVLNLEAKDDKDAIRQLANRLFKAGYVKESFIEAIIEREANYPTGLSSGDMGVAIPHTDSIHVNKAALAIGILKEPVKFQMMGMPEKSVYVSLVFMMAIDDPNKHLEMLKTLMNIFQQHDLLTKLKNARKLEEVANIFDNVI